MAPKNIKEVGGFGYTKAQNTRVVFFAFWQPLQSTPECDALWALEMYPQNGLIDSKMLTSVPDVCPLMCSYCKKMSVSNTVPIFFLLAFEIKTMARPRYLKVCSSHRIAKKRLQGSCMLCWTGYWSYTYTAAWWGRKHTHGLWKTMGPMLTLPNARHPKHV